MQPRPYQETALAGVIAALDSSPCLVLPTGAGKTFTAAELVRRLGRPTLWLAHRRELIAQAAQSLYRLGLDVGVVMAGSRPNPRAQVQVASISTLLKRTVPACTLVVVDEAHHARAATYRKILDPLRAFGANVVGLTATPWRLDGRGLGDIFGALVVGAYPDDLIRDGTLVEPVVYAPSTPDLRGVHVQHGDYNVGELVGAMGKPKLVGDIVEHWQRLSPGRRTVVFAVNVKHSEQIVAAFKAAGVRAEHLDGTTAAGQRDAILHRLRTGYTTVVSQCQVLCLDSATEVLTNNGWRGPDTIRRDDRVANWESGAITFEPPIEIVRRARAENERMVVIRTPRVDVRVTEGHRLIYRSGDRCRWRKAAARSLVARHLQVPVSGIAEPFDLAPEPIARPRCSRATLITKTAWNLRNREGYSVAGSRVEAERRVDRVFERSYKAPSEVTLDECRLIGFWVGDGSRVALQSGGVEYVLSQSEVYPRIIAWVDRVLLECGFHAVRRQRGHTVPHVRWSLPRGTGGGTQEREGIYRIEPYCDKQGAILWWGFSRSQFDAFIEGLWYADGNHGLAERGMPAGRCSITSVNRDLLSLVQAIAVCRGYRARISRCAPPRKRNHRQLWSLSFRKATTHSLHSVSTSLLARFEQGWSSEDVWCVRTRTKNIVTRRNGAVVVMGNTEGWDLPALETAIVARPTASLNLHLQIIGRTMRTADGKAGATILDHAGNHLRHGPVTQRVEYSLLDESRAKRSQDANAPPCKRCPECFLICTPQARECPACGHAFGSGAAPIEHAPGELVAFRPAERPSIAVQQQAWEAIETQRQARGYREGWSFFRFQDRFGFRPLVHDGVVCDPATVGGDVRRAVLDRFQSTAAAKGYKPGWAAYQYRAVFGVWPRRTA